MAVWQSLGTPDYSNSGGENNALSNIRRTLLAAGLVASAVAAQATVTIDLVPVGNAGNAGQWIGPDYGGVGDPDTNRLDGAVGYDYQIGKYEVTAGQYAEFLNAVAATDTYGLYNTNMATGVWAGVTVNQITRSGTSGSYTYAVGPNYADRAIGYVAWGSAVRFVNWLANGQPTGAEDASTTEDGSYLLNGAVSNSALNAVVRKEGATYVLPSEDEWYKAAFHKNDGVTGNYWDYATGSNTIPTRELTSPDPGNNANYRPSGFGGTDYCIGAGPPYYHTNVGAFTNSVSPYGTFDQNGNTSEWTEGLIETDGSRVWMGGGFNDKAEMMYAYTRVSNVPTYTSLAIGFRVGSLEPAAGGDVVWTGTGGTAWSSTGNWTPGSTPNGVKNTFDDTATGLTADIASAATPTSVVFNNSSKNFTITGTSGIGGTATVLKQGTGTVTMSSINTYSGVTTVEAGKLILSGAAKAMVPVLNNGGADIKGGMLVLDYATEADPVATVKNLLTTSYAAGAWNTGKFQSSTSSSSRGLGWNDNTGTSKINVAYTVYGDTNLDGTTNFTDLSKLLSKYGQTSKTWADGDTNYDGVVNFTDLSKMLSTYGQSVGSLTPSPEPSTMVLLVTLAGLVGAWVIRRRGQ